MPGVLKPISLTGRARLRWCLACAVCVGAGGGLVVGLLVRPVATLSVWWNVVVPLLPVSFLIAPVLWRSICPLATLNMASNGWWSRRAVSVRALPAAGGTGIVLLGLLVPARRFILNEDAAVLAAVLIGLALVALALGLPGAAPIVGRAGFFLLIVLWLRRALRRVRLPLRPRTDFGAVVPVRALLPGWVADEERPARGERP